MKTVIAAMAIAVFGVGAAAEEPALRQSREMRRRGVAFHAVSEQAQRGYDKMKAGDGKAVFVARKPSFSSSDLASANVVPSGKGSGLTLVMNPAAAERLGPLMRDKVGDRLAILVNGKLLAAPVIESPTTRGTITLSKFESGRAERIVQTLWRHLQRDPEGITLVADQSAGRAGDQILVDVFVKGATNLRGYQVALDATGGETGRLQLEDIIIDEGRADYIFEGVNSFNAVNTQSQSMVNALPAGTVDRAERSYLATFVFRVSSDAKGDFRVVVRGGDETVLLDANTEQLALPKAAETTISIR